MVTLRPMIESDLPLVLGWLREPHVAHWWFSGQPATPEVERDAYRARITGRDGDPTVMLTILERDAPIGWCQWYRWDAYPDEARAVGALPGEVGIDYAIGDPAAVGRGLGTAMIAALVGEVRRHHPGCGVLVEPDAANAASRRVLERNGFQLVAVRPLPFELSDKPMAIYRLPHTEEYLPRENPT